MVAVVSDYKDTNFWKQFTTYLFHNGICGQLFQTTKIQTFESNSQLAARADGVKSCCFRLQRYKLLKAIHNLPIIKSNNNYVVSDYKDTNFWKQFTTYCYIADSHFMLFQTTKIQTFESNSQPIQRYIKGGIGCFRLQRYKLLKAIHNILMAITKR